MTFIHSFRLYVFMAFALAFAVSAYAEGEKAQLDSWRAELDGVEASLQRPALADDALAALRDRVEPVRVGARELANDLGPRILALQLRLGVNPDDAKSAQTPAPAASPQTAADRRLLAELENAQRQSRVTLARAEDVYARIVERRRALLVSTVVARSASLIDPSLWIDALGSAPRLSDRFRSLLNDWWTILITRGPGPAAGALLLALALAAGFLGPGRAFLLRFRRATDAPDMGEKARNALWVALVNTAVPTLALSIVFFAIQTFRLIPTRIESILPGIVFAIALSSLMVGLARGLLAPGRPNWRIAPMPDEAASRLSLLVSLIAAAAATALIGDRLLGALDASKEIVTAWRGLGTLFIAVVVMLSLRTIAARIAPAEDGGGLPFPWSLVVPAAWLASIAATAAGLLGFVTLGVFIVSQLLWTSSLLALLFLLLTTIAETFASAFHAGTPIGQTLSRSLGLSGAKIEQLGVVASGIVRLMLIAVAALLALAPYGVESGDALGWLGTLFAGVEIGGVTLSPSAVLAAFAVFLIGVAATRGLQRWLDTQFLPRTRMDLGVRSSVKTGIGYVGIVAASMIAFGSLGLNLSNLAIVAGALSVGVGFGLQSIVNNFVSGLILLAERPIRVGDWIVVGEEEGVVKRINVRATEIETFDRATVIIPNSDLISGKVKNWVHADRTARVTIPVGVSYSSDPQKVRAVLLDCAKSHPNVLLFPEPHVFFKQFGEASLDFEVFCYVDDVNKAIEAKSDLLFAILAKLREAKIEIPFGQNDVTIGNMNDIVTALKAFGDAAALGEPRRRLRLEGAE